MKKMLGFFVAVAVLAASSISVFAADPITAKDQDLESYTTSGSGESAGAMMTMLMVKAPNASGDLTIQDITVETIQYIDQTTADASGNYTFANYIPKTAIGANTYVVLVGGQNISSPFKQVILGAPISQDITFVGNVAAIGKGIAPTIKLIDKLTSDEHSGTVDPATGNFSIDAPAGSYVLEVSKPGYLTFKIDTFTLAEDTVDGAYSLRAGDVDGSNDININDVSFILASYGTKKDIDGAYIAARDLDDSNDININDVSFALANYGVKASDLNLATN